MDILLDFNDYEHWMNDVDESYLINRFDSSYYVFIHEDAAWPMQNRYQVSKMSIQKGDIAEPKFDFSLSRISLRSERMRFKSSSLKAIGSLMAEWRISAHWSMCSSRIRVDMSLHG